MINAENNAIIEAPLEKFLSKLRSMENEILPVLFFRISTLLKKQEKKWNCSNNFLSLLLTRAENSFENQEVI